MTETPITVIGLGAMGSALAETLLRNGHPTTVWNRTSARAEPLAAKGAAVAKTVEDAVSASPLVIICVVTNDVTRALLEPIRASLAGRAIVNLTNGTPAQAREISTWATESGAEYLDGGIMATPPLIGKPEAVVFYSGSRHLFDTHRATLERLGTARHFGPDPGTAALYDIALLTGMYGMFSGFLNAAALMRAENVTAADLLALYRPFLDAMVPSLQEYARQMDARDYGSNVSSPLAMQAAAFENFVRTAEDKGVVPDLLVPLGQLMDRAVASGHGEHDLASVIEVMAVSS